MTPPEVSHQLRLAGLRANRARESVLRRLVKHPHATTEQIRSGVAEQLGSAPAQAVHDGLAAFTRAGPVRRIEPAGHPTGFARRVGGNHHLMRPTGYAMAAVPEGSGKNPIHHKEER